MKIGLVVPGIDTEFQIDECFGKDWLYQRDGHIHKKWTRTDRV